MLKSMSPILVLLLGLLLGSFVLPKVRAKVGI